MIFKLNVNGQLHNISIEPAKDKLFRITFRYNKDVIDEIKALEGAMWDPDERCWFAKDSERNRWNFKHWLNNYEPLYDKELIKSITADCRQHQNDIFSHLIQRKRCIVAGEPGIGKTLPTIRAMEHFGEHWWIICPKTTKYVWYSELKKWNARLTEGIGSFKYLIIPSHMLASIITKENIVFPDHIVVDESHWFKNWQAQRTQAVNILANKIRTKNGCIFLITGTPSPRDPTDWWAQTEICQPGFLRESTKAKLMKRLGFVEQGVGRAGQIFNKLTGWNNVEVEKIYHRLKGLVLIKRKKDCLDLPDKIYQEIQLPCDNDTLNAAKFILDGQISGAQGLNYLRQFSDGFNYKQNITIPTPKDDALIELTDEIINNGESPRVVIFAGFTQSIDKICELLSKQEWKTIRLDGRGLFSEIKNPLEEFQNKDFKEPIAFIGQPRAGGISITLTAAETIIFYSNDFDASARMQAEDRIHRIGTTHARIVDLLWLPSDKLTLNNLKLKRELQNITLGELRNCLQ